MTTMVVASFESGRVNQKRRTHQAIVEAARTLLKQGIAPTVGEAADAALVSRATAYRYFPNRDALLLEAAAPAMAPAQEALAPISHSTDAVERIRFVAEHMQREVIDHETQVRAVARLSLERWLASKDGRDEAVVIRPGNRIGWIAEALAPLRGRIPRRDLRRLELALATVLGTEALIALRDVCRVGYDEAVEVSIWAAATLVQAAVRANDQPPAQKGTEDRKRSRKPTGKGLPSPL
jgi:AcrR family transcriptional regulator